jgi:alpha-L-fucosidase 2
MFDIAQPLVEFLAAAQPFLRVNVAPYSADSMGIAVAAAYDGDSSLGFPGVTDPYLGDLVWLMHLLSLHGAHSLNATLETSVLFPILREAVSMYLLHWTFNGTAAGSNGSAPALHINVTQSPEYPYPPSNPPSNDTNYDLALVRWGCAMLLDLNAAYGLDDPLAPRWQDALTRLAPAPADGNGLMVASTVPFAIPHRHFSHMFSIYPLHLLPFDAADGGTPADDALIQTSLDWWFGLTCGAGSECPNGFTFDGAASISALMGDSEARRAAAVGNITAFLASGLVHASTMYDESGGMPCIESPLAAATSTQEVLLQSWGGRVRVFPAVPAAWPDVVIGNMSAEGGLLVSAVRTNGTTRWVAVTAQSPAAVAARLTGRMGARGGVTPEVPAEPLVPTAGAGRDRRSASPLGGHWSTRRHRMGDGGVATTVTLATDMAGPYATVPAGVAITVLPNGDLSFAVPEDGTVVVYPSAAGPQTTFSVQMLPGNATQFNFWGLH